LGPDRFQTVFNVATIIEDKVIFSKSGTALDALDVNAVDIALQREVAAAPLAGFGPDYREHWPPFTPPRFLC
jgi:hypothetical protein